MAKTNDSETPNDAPEGAQVPAISEGPKIHEPSRSEPPPPAPEEPKPVAEEPEPAPEPAEGAPPVPVEADGKKPPTKIILGAVGGVVGLILLILLISALTGGGHPYSVPGTSAEIDEKEVKPAGKSYVTFLEKREWSRTEVMMKRRKKLRNEQELDKKFYTDEGKYEKKRKQGEKMFEFFGDKDDDLEKFEIADEKEEDVKEGEKKGLKLYTCTVKGKRMVPSGDEDWKLEDRKDAYKLWFSKIGGEWRLVEGTVNDKELPKARPSGRVF